MPDHAAATLAREARRTLYLTRAAAWYRGAAAARRAALWCEQHGQAATMTVPPSLFPDRNPQE